MGARPYRRNRQRMLVESDVCGICGHGGAQTADHIIPDPLWPRDETGRRLPGFDGRDNLQPAHGTMGATGAINPCPYCGALCNQSKGARLKVGQPRSRKW